MRTTLDLDKQLMEELVKESGCESKTEALETAAREYLRFLRRQKMVSNFGKLALEPVYKELRKKDRAEARKMMKRGLA